MFVVHLHAQHVQAVTQGGTSAASSENDAVVVDTHVLGVHDFVGLHILEHTVLVDAAGVGKGVTSHHCLVGLHGHVHQAAHHAAGGVYLRGIDVGLHGDGAVALDNHGNLLK